MTAFAGGSAVAVVSTGADGTYTHAGLVAGDYAVGFVDPGGAYVAEFWDDRATLGEADSIAVAGGSTSVIARRSWACVGSSSQNCAQDW